MIIALQVNGESLAVDVDPATPLLWVIREQLQLSGTKFGCGVAQCGACTVHLDGMAISCLCYTGAGGERATDNDDRGSGQRRNGVHPVQQARIDEQVPQCGYCQSGQIMSAIALLQQNNDPSEAEIDAAMKGNICRCGTYQWAALCILGAVFFIFRSKLAGA